MVNLGDFQEDMTTQELTPKEVSRELRRLSDAVNKSTKFLFGNGDSIGIDEIIRNLSKGFDDFKKRQENEKKEVEDNRRFYKRLIVGALVTNAIIFAGTLFGWLLYWYARIYPLLQELEKGTK